MNYTIPVSVCPVPCKNPIVIFLEYIKTLPSYTDPTFDPTDPVKIAAFLNDVLDLINNDTFVIEDNNCDNLCKPTCPQACVSYMLSSNPSQLSLLLGQLAPHSGPEASVFPCCLNVSGYAQNLGYAVYPYELLNCNYNTYSCCNAFNYELMTKLALFVMQYSDPTDDLFQNVNSTNDFLFEFGTFEHESAIPTILAELETFPGYLPFELWSTIANNGIVVISNPGSSNTIITNLINALNACGIYPVLE